MDNNNLTNEQLEEIAAITEGRLDDTLAEIDMQIVNIFDYECSVWALTVVLVFGTLIWMCVTLGGAL